MTHQILKKRKHSNRKELQSNKNRNTTQPNYTEKTKTRPLEMNKENLKRIILKKKTALPSPRNPNKKTVKTETKKINKLLAHISMNNITELNELI